MEKSFMRTVGWLLGALGVAILIWGAYHLFSSHQSASSNGGLLGATPTREEGNGAIGATQVNVFLVALNDDGKLGKKIGCGDSIVAVSKSILPTTTPLRAALRELLSLKERTYGEAGLYNSLYQSNLKVTDANIDNQGKATVYLTGSMALGGVCDDPRFAAQIEETVLQFPTVHEAAIFVNGRTLKDVTSEQ